MRHSLLSSQTKLGQLSRGEKYRLLQNGWWWIRQGWWMDGWMDACMHACMGMCRLVLSCNVSWIQYGLWSLELRKCMWAWSVLTWWPLNSPLPSPFFSLIPFYNFWISGVFINKVLQALKNSSLSLFKLLGNGYGITKKRGHACVQSWRIHVCPIRI